MYTAVNYNYHRFVGLWPWQFIGWQLNKCPVQNNYHCSWKILFVIHLWHSGKTLDSQMRRSSERTLNDL